jgi:hypothetical protein
MSIHLILLDLICLIIFGVHPIVVVRRPTDTVGSIADKVQPTAEAATEPQRVLAMKKNRPNWYPAGRLLLDLYAQSVHSYPVTRTFHIAMIVCTKLWTGANSLST